MDTTGPSTPSITYNGGSNTCSWKNNYNLTLSSTDNIGISYYQIDVDGNGTADRNINSNWIPENGFHSHNVRFRAVDSAGNVSGWTSSQHIHMNTYIGNFAYVEASCNYTGTISPCGNVTAKGGNAQAAGLTVYSNRVCNTSGSTRTYNITGTIGITGLYSGFSNGGVAAIWLSTLSNDQEGKGTMGFTYIGTSTENKTLNNYQLTNGSCIYFQNNGGVPAIFKITFTATY